MLFITDKKLIGRREEIDFPELGLFKIDAKVDTGAHTTALHCHKITTYHHRRKLYVAFYLLDPGYPQYKDKRIKMPVTARRRIKSSSGEAEKRVIITTNIKAGGEKYPIEISLTDRSKMEFPVLLGRKFLSRRFIVDVGHYNLLQKNLKKNKK